MRFKLSGRPELGATGDLQVVALVGDMPVRCVVERSAVTAGFAGPFTSEAEMLQLFAARKPEIESIASELFFNGARSPVVKRQHMFC